MTRYCLGASELKDLVCAAADKLEEAAEDIENWGCYASDYFQCKHGLVKDVESYREYAKQLREKVSR